MNGTEVLEIKNEEIANDGYKYSKEDICSICNVDEKTFRRFFEEARLDTDVQPKIITDRDFISVGSSHKKMYTEQVLQKFQAWLMKNQANQGKASEVVKQATMDNLEIGVAANYVMSSGSIEAAQQFAQLLISRTEAIAKSKQLESENQQLVHALEYDEVKDWKKWSELKKELAQNFELLRHKINYTKLFDEVGLVENEDYKRKVLGFDKFPTVLISPEAEDMLWDWLDGHN